MASHAKRTTAARASVFAALGDTTRLSMLGKLAGGEAKSISHLAKGTPLTRQAVSKHLRVLEEAGLVRAERVGREVRFGLEQKPLADARDWLGTISQQWDDALARLKAFAEGA